MEADPDNTRVDGNTSPQRRRSFRFVLARGAAVLVLVCVTFVATEVVSAVRRDSYERSPPEGCEVLDSVPASLLLSGQQRPIDLDTARLSEFLDFGDLIWAVREIPDNYPDSGVVHGTAERTSSGLVVRVAGLPDLVFGMVFIDCVG